MKLIYSQGFSKNERLEWRPVIFNNVVQSFRTIHEAMSEIGIEYKNPDNEVSHRAPQHPASTLSASVCIRTHTSPAAPRDICSAPAN